MKKRPSVTLPTDLQQLVEDQADLEDRSMSNMIAELCRRGLGLKNTPPPSRTSARG